MSALASTGWVVEPALFPRVVEFSGLRLGKMRGDDREERGKEEIGEGRGGKER